jgi:ferredoxin
MQDVTLTIVDKEGQATAITVPVGANLRTVLLEAGYSPYTQLTERLNCGGNGLCATCGVWIDTNSPEPTHWHDKAAHRFGYPRLSCKITIEEPMTVRLVKKLIWGSRARQ